MGVRFQREWPEDLDAVCPRCGQEFNALVNYSEGPGKLGQEVRRVHPWMVSIPVLVFPVVMYFWMKAVHSKTAASPTMMVFFMIVLIIPPMITGAMMVFGRVMRRVRCHICGYTEEYPMRGHDAGQRGAGVNQ